MNQILRFKNTSKSGISHLHKLKNEKGIKQQAEPKNPNRFGKIPE
jgi:hypothetical protein